MSTFANLQKAAKSMGIRLTAKGKPLTKEQLTKELAKNKRSPESLTLYELVIIARQQGVSPYANGRLLTKKKLMSKLNLSQATRLTSEVNRYKDEAEFMTKQLELLHEKYSKLKAKCP